MHLLSFFHVQIDRGESMQKGNKDKRGKLFNFSLLSKFVPFSLHFKFVIIVSIIIIILGKK